MGEALDYGYSLFETIRFQEGMPQNLERHYSRIENSAQILDILFDKTVTDFKNELLSKMKQTSLTSGVLRYQLLKQGTDSQVHIQIKENRYKKSMYFEGFKVGLSGLVKYSDAPLVQHKTSNYLENLLTLKQMKQSGFDEGLITNEKNHLTEGTYTNIFLIKEGAVFTPPLEDGLLGGTMRAQVIEWCKAHDIEVHQANIAKDTLSHYQAGFLTNALMGIMPIRQIDQAIHFELKHDLTQRIAEGVMHEWILE